MLLLPLYLLLTYLLASVPFGLVLSGFFADVDVREQGSGNIGATNVARVVGKRMGALTLALDLLKGLLPVLGVSLLHEAVWLPALVGLVAVVGHCFPVYLAFRGGKGVATAAGALLAFVPWAALAALAVWIAVFAGLRKSSLAALIAVAVAVGVVAWLYPPQLLAVLAIAGVIVLRHVSNIRRLIRGEESRMEGLQR